jgi:hypothetical protein
VPALIKIMPSPIGDSFFSLEKQNVSFDSKILRMLYVCRSRQELIRGSPTTFPTKL